MTNPGTIYLVGTGPGDPGLITVKGLALVREADALVGDTLAHAWLLAETRLEAEWYDTGSLQRGNKEPQARVTQRLLDLARQGKTVVRLWPGDPFVFGRAADEMIQARRAGIRVELAPGVTSAIAAPAYAGVPVTHWDYGVSFAVVTGFGPDQAVRPDWAALAGVDTLVILMPLENLPEIVSSLLAAGRPAGTPTLVVQQATLPQQKQVQTTLGRLVEAVQMAQIQHPAVVVVGEVVQLAAELAWFGPADSQPLRGKRVLVTRPVHQATDFMVALRALGAEPIAFPTIEIGPVEDTSPLDEAIGRISQAANQRVSESANQRISGSGGQRGGEAARQGQLGVKLKKGETSVQPAYDWLVLTSANGVAAVWERLQSAGLDSRCLAPVRIAAIGPATAGALQRRSIRPDLIPEVYTAEGVLAAFDRLGPVKGQRFLLARADIARKALAEGLIQRGAQVDEVAAYRTVPVQGGTFPPAADMVTFTSSSTVQGYVNCLGGRSPAEVLKDSQVICIGPITAATARELGLPVSATAEAYTIEGILETLVRVKRET